MDSRIGETYSRSVDLGIPESHTSPRSVKGRRLGLRLRSALFAVCGLVVVVVLWQLAAWSSDPSQVPAPLAVLHSLEAGWKQIPVVFYLDFQSGGISSAVLYTSVNVLVGVTVGATLGLPLGIAMARSQLVRSLLEVPLSLLGTLPLLALLPFITLWFGTARFSQSGLVILFSFLIMAFAAQNAAVTVSDQYSNYASSLGASRQRILWTVVLPASGPTMVGAARVALAAGWGWQVVAELLGAHAGVGRVIEVTARVGAISDLAATVLFLATVALVCDAVVAAVGGALVRWRPS
jgi:ABC-type nitrate/sulfonate/bicarbonate transport system permease component